MARTTPYGGLSNDRLTALINFYNPTTQVTEGVDFTYGPPEEYSDGLGRNSKVTLVPVEGTQYAGPEDVHYWRLPISVLSLLPAGFVQPVVIDAFPFSIHASLAAINEALGLNLTPSEVEDTIYSEEQSTYTLTALGANSLAWIDSTYEFQVQLPGQLIPLNTVIVSPSLSGLVYVQPPS
jgi:hypothetical protein